VQQCASLNQICQVTFAADCLSMRMKASPDLLKKVYNRRNVIFASILGIVAVSYWLFIGLLTSGSKEAERNGQRGEAAGLMVAILLPFALYATCFFLAVLSNAVRRGSKPESPWILGLGLLPTITIGLLWLYAIITAG
jgi:hypothetical protein